MFINTLPIIYIYTHLFTAVEANLFIIALFLLVYVYTPESQSSCQENKKSGWYLFLHAAWLGNAPLWQAFWPFLVFVNGVLIYIDYRIDSLTYTIASWITVHFMLVLPIVWWIVAVWRCTAHTRFKLFGSFARTATLCLIIEFILRFIITVKYPNTFFDCHLMVVQFGECL